MSTPRPMPTDADLKHALARRAIGAHTSAELVGSVLTAVELLPQARGWLWRLAPPPRLVPILLVTGLLLSAMIGYGILGGAAVTPPAPLRGAGDIVFLAADYSWDESNRGWVADNPRLNLVSSGGGEPTRLVDLPGAERLPLYDEYERGLAVRNGPDPEWSPDGTRIAFRVFHDEPGIYLIDRDGRNMTRLTDLPEVRGYWPDAGFAWSPDGTQIAFAYREDGTEPASIYLVDTDDGRLTRLSDRGSARPGPASARLGHGWLDVTDFAWSPDGLQIAFVKADDERTTGLYVINRDGTGERRLSEADFHEARPWGYRHAGVAWSPDGSRIAFAWSPYDGDSMFVIGADGSAPREVAGPWSGPEGLAIDALVWSPDGSLIAGSRRVAPGDVIVVTDPDEPGARVVNEGESFDWSPDGSRLVVGDESLSSFAPPVIYLVDADDTERRWLAEGHYPDWSPIARER